MHASRIHPLTPTILIADDEEVVRRLLQRLLERQGFTVLIARDGQEAVEFFYAHRAQIRLVLLDVLMPRLDGPSALLKMTQLDPNVVSCFMTGYTGHYEEADLLGFGARRVFRKPFHLGDITQTVADLCPASARVA